MTKSKSKPKQGNLEWTCSGCGSRTKSKKKPKRCPLCGVTFKDIRELVK